MNAGELMEKVALNRQIKAVYNIGLRRGMEKTAATSPWDQIKAYEDAKRAQTSPPDSNYPSVQDIITDPELIERLGGVAGTARNQRIGGAAAGAGLGGFLGGALGGRNRLLWGGLGSIAGGVGGHEAVRFHQNNPEFLSRLADLMRKGVSKGVSSARGLLNK